MVEDAQSPADEAPSAGDQHYRVTVVYDVWCSGLDELHDIMDNSLTSSTHIPTAAGITNVTRAVQHNPRRAEQSTHLEHASLALVRSIAH